MMSDNDNREGETISTGSERLHIQQGLPDCESPEVTRRNKDDKREYNRKRQALLREKRKSPRLIKAVVETFGFYGFYKSSIVYIDYYSHIWDTSSYNREYYQEASKVLFTGYVPTFRDILILLVVRISNQDAKSALPSINYLTRAYPTRQEDNG